KNQIRRMKERPEETRNLQNLLDWADEHLEVLRKEKEIADYSAQYETKSSTKRKYEGKSSSKAHVATSSRRSAAQESESEQEEEESSAEEDDDEEVEGRTFYWTPGPESSETVLEYNDETESYRVYKFTRALECAMCGEKHSIRAC